MKLDAEELHRLSEHLDDLIEATLAERSSRLALIRRTAPEMAHRLAELLARQAAVETGDFMATLPKFLTEDSSTTATRSGERVGPYEVLQELGQGGMSTVWLARRVDGALSRTVALKLPYSGAYGRQLTERFARERDILASLSHSNIARLYDAGVSEQGQPYLAMEYVQGTPISVYCDSLKLPIAKRLTLFLQVCNAVQFAHSQLVIHRDLKPSNILVTEQAHVMLLDFGIAKLLTRSPARETELTLFGARAMTVNYASPEQIAGEPIGTASDIYSLGVLLCEMLTGALPYRPNRDTRGALEEAILSSDITLPSHSVFGESAAIKRKLSNPELRKQLREDLDGIVFKAMQRQPRDRYGTVDALSQDIVRYLSGLPISAYASHRWYRWRKFWRRHRLPVSLAVGVLAVIIAGAITIAWQAVREREQARRADQEASRQKATKDFLVSVFKASDPRIESDRPGGTITAKELLEASAGRIDQEFSRDPATRIELLGLTSDIFRELGEDTRAAKLLQEQIQLAGQLYGPDHRVVIEGLLQQASDANDRNDAAAATKLLTRTDAAIHRAGLDRSAERARWWYIKSGALLNDASARPEMEQALRNSAGLFESIGINDSTYSNALSDLANVYFAKPDFPMAVQYNQRAVAALEHQAKGSEGDLVQIYGNLATALTYAGDFDAAQRSYSKATELAGRTYGFNHRFYWVSAGRFAQTVHLGGDFRRASEMFERLMPTLPTAASGYRSRADEHEAGVVNEAFGACLLADGRAARAIAYLQAAEQQYADAPQYFYERDHLRSILAQAYDETGRTADAQRLLKESISGYEKHFSASNPAVLRQHELRAASFLRHGQLADAERDFTDILARMEDPRSFVVVLAEAGLAEVAAHRGDAGAASLHSLKAENTWKGVRGYRDVRMGSYVARVRAQALLLVGDIAGARERAAEALKDDMSFDDPQSAELHAAAALARAADQPNK